MMRSFALAALLVLLAGGALSAAPAARKKPAAKPPAREPAAKPPARKPAPPSPAPARTPEIVLSGPMDTLMLEREKRAALSHTELEVGALGLIFDGNPRTYARAVVPPAPAPRHASYQITLSAPRAIDEAGVAFGEGAEHRWSLTAADSPADLQARRGSFRVLVPARAAKDPSGDLAAFTKPRPYRVYRLECERLTGEGGAALAEWSLWTPQKLSEMAIAAPIPEVGRGGLLALRVNATFDAGGRQNMTPDVTWEVSPATRGTVDAFSRFEAREEGPTRVTAVYRGIRSRPFELVVQPEIRPDWTVTYIERQPRLDYERAPGIKPGQSVSWFAHVKNYGTGDAGPVAAEWRVDGRTVGTVRLPKISRFGQTEAILPLPWDEKRHEIELVVDPRNEILETSEANNARKVYSDALSVGFWVEESLVRYFHRNQRALNAGSNSWEDWAQRQIDFWNQAMESAPAAPRERWRLDRIVIVGDGMLPLSGSEPVRRPDARDRSVNLTIGFPAYEAALREQYGRTKEKSLDNPFYIQQSLLQAFDHLRYHQLTYRPTQIATRGRVRRAAELPIGAPRARPFERKMRLPR